MTGPRVTIDPGAFDAITATCQAAQRQVEQVTRPLNRFAADLALFADAHDRIRHLRAQVGTRNAHVVRSVERLQVADVVAILDAIEHDTPVEPRLQRFVDVVRAALTGRAVTRRDVVRARRAARRVVRRPERRRPDRRVDHRTRIEAGCTSRPRAPGSRSARSRVTSAPARPVTRPRGSPV